MVNPKMQVNNKHDINQEEEDDGNHPHRRSSGLAGLIELINGRYKFTTIDLYPEIFIADEDLWEKANLAVEKTHRYCLISNSVNADIYYHTEVFYRPANEISNQLKPGTARQDTTFGEGGIVRTNYS